MRKLVAGGLLVGCVVMSATGAAARDCPNVRATHVKATVYESAKRDRCGVGISIFGLELSVFGPSCPVARFTEPAHGECFGAPLEGFMCVPDGTLNVLYETCACAGLTAFGTGLTLPRCDCTLQPLGGGMITNWSTKACSTNTKAGPTR